MNTTFHLFSKKARQESNVEHRWPATSLHWGPTSTATTPTHHDRQARCNDSLCHHSHQVCLLRLSGLRTADVQKSKTDASFQLQQKQQNHRNKTKVEARDIQPGFSRSDCVLAINYNLARGMLCTNCPRWKENDSKMMCLSV